MLGFWLIISSLQGYAGTSEELKNLYSKALKHSQSVSIARAREEQALERKVRIRGEMLPTVSARYNYQAVDATPAPRSPFTRLNQYSTFLNLNQPIYNGGAYSAYSYSKLDIELQARLKEQAAHGLWVEVAENYYALWMAHVAVENSKQRQQLFYERVQELGAKVRVGRSRKGELLQAQSQLAAASAALVRSESEATNSWERMKFIVGDGAKLSFPMVPTEAAQLTPLEGFLLRINNRQDLKVQSQELLLTEVEIKVARSGHHPTINLTSNYYLERTGVLAESEWDLGINVVVPIFQGGTVNAQTNEVLSRRREQVMRFEQLKDEAVRDVRILWQSVHALEVITKDLKTALDKAQATYNETKRDYSYGLVTSLDVLVALNDFIDKKSEYERACLERELLARQLSFAVGETP